MSKQDPKYDKYLEEIVENQSDVLIASSAPSPATNGMLYVNSVSGVMYLYWGSWQSTGITLTPALTGQPMGLLISITYS
jgi:hypothetical protein